MSSNAVALVSRCCVLGRMLVVGATFTVAFVVITTNRSPAHLPCESKTDHGTKGAEWFEKELRNGRRSLQNVQSVMSGGQRETQSRGQLFWPMHREPRNGMNRLEESRHVRRDDDDDFHDFEGHHHRRYNDKRDKKNDDDDDSGDDNDHHHRHKHQDNDDDDSEDDNNPSQKNSDDDTDSEDNRTKDNENTNTSKNANQEGSQSSSDQEQSPSILTNMDGVNIGNTITIINVNTGSPGSSGTNEPSDTASSALNDTSRSAITSAAIRAFCDSIRCMQSQGAPFIPESISNNVPVVPSVTGTTAVGNGAVVSNAEGRATMMRANWLLLVATLIILHMF